MMIGKVLDMAKDALISERASATASTDPLTDVVVPAIVTSRVDLEAIRDTWLAPLVQRISELERGVASIVQHWRHTGLMDAIREGDRWKPTCYWRN